LTAAPKLRGRDAARLIEILLTEDAQAATAGARAHGPTHLPPLRTLTPWAGPRPKDLDADLATLAPELRWRERMGRVEAVIFASKEPVSREVLARGVGPDCVPSLQLIDIPVLESVNVDGLREIEFFVIQPSLDRSPRPAVPLGDLRRRQTLAG
jgi:hypothetical protein